MINVLCKCVLLVLLSVLDFSFFPEAAPAKAFRHPFYVSVTQIDQNISAKTFEITCKFFADDFESIIEKDYNAQLDMTAQKDKPAFDKFIPDYVSKRFQLKVNGKNVTLNYIGFEKDKESAYAYFEVSNVTNIASINIMNKLLYDFTDQEINIMHVTVMGKRQSTKLDYPAAEASFNF